MASEFYGGLGQVENSMYFVQEESALRSSNSIQEVIVISSNVGFSIQYPPGGKTEL